ncbi:MAG TPA: cysteine hydrolase family protein [Candidatus Binataceae bacterium]|nr:cysteine hydrolase family protein [Candidatus Binataceae bacterium]
MKRALLVIDVQNEYFSGKLPVSYPAGSLERIVAAMDAARAHNVPVVVVRHTARGDRGVFKQGTPEWELHKEVAARPHDRLIDKTMPSSFAGTELESWLRQNGIDTLAIAGYMTQMCCDSTARDGFHRGFRVEFLADATGTLSLGTEAGKVADRDLHNAVLVTQSTMFSKVMKTADWIRSLEQK